MEGFGLVWCNQPGIKSSIGYPIDEEHDALGGDQAFANGVIFYNPAGDAYYVVQNDGNRWHYYKAHRHETTPGGDGNLIGRANLQGRTDHSGVTVMGPGGQSLTTGIGGSFAFEFEGSGTLRAYHSGYLDVTATVNVAAGSVLDLGEGVLLGGDANSDGKIDILDISYIGSRYGSADAQADITGDGTVNILDLTLAGINYGKVGPIVWTP